MGGKVVEGKRSLQPKLVAACWCVRSFDRSGGPSIEPEWYLHPSCPECGRSRIILDMSLVPVVTAALRLVVAEEKRGEMPFQMDVLLADLRKAVAVVDPAREPSESEKGDK
jgi:hypothetical protein